MGVAEEAAILIWVGGVVAGEQRGHHRVFEAHICSRALEPDRFHAAVADSKPHAPTRRVPAPSHEPTPVHDAPVARTWLSIRIELVEGRGGRYWPRPGRIFGAARRHTFADLAEAIDVAFARWDRAHLHQFDLPGDRIVTTDDEDAPEDSEPSSKVRLSTLDLGAQFSYMFDLGDMWTHLCTVGPSRIDPFEEFGFEPERPLPYWGWGAIPDQYGREFDDYEGDDRPGEDPGWKDLPPLHPHWGASRR